MSGPPTDPGEFVARLPLGWSEVEYAGRRYGLSRTVQVGGRSEKVYAEELGGSDVVSANLYRPRQGPAVLRPCEMSAAKVTSFLAGLRLRGGGSGSLGGDLGLGGR
ncbi:hypothetical protein [Nocardioides pantholopis]|uniref:hypothetical protein n=1 Tax=Nocardioides pantholopis TaxID=2483798 RepID=UPI0019D09F4E|nr:hypothetical protein [Nocardioides pantholopis]